MDMAIELARSIRTTRKPHEWEVARMHGLEREYTKDPDRFDITKFDTQEELPEEMWMTDKAEVLAIIAAAAHKFEEKGSIL